MLPPGSPKPEGSGRKKGTANKRTEQVRALLEGLDCDPIAILAHFAKGDAKALKLRRGEKVSVEVRFGAAKELAQYVAPKLKAIEVTVEESSEPIRVKVDLTGRGGAGESDG
jgi:hypothetical protein